MGICEVERTHLATRQRLSTDNQSLDIRVPSCRSINIRNGDDIVFDRGLEQVQKFMCPFSAHRKRLQDMFVRLVLQ